MHDTVKRIGDLSAEEIADALRVERPILRRAVLAMARVPNMRLARSLARFDARTAEIGIARAAAETLGRFGARVLTDGAAPAAGPLLAVANHPGAYDALALMAALARDDVAFVASDRAFLRAMPNVARHLFLVDERSTRSRAVAIRAALEHLARGGALVQFGAGAIEPDAAFDRDREPLGAWSAGTGLFASRAARVVPVFVSGVHSPRAKRLRLVRWAEARGTTTIAPLVQATLPGFADVVVRVRIGDPIDLAGASDHERRTAVIRAAVARLHESGSRSPSTSEATGRSGARSVRAPRATPSSA